MLSLYTNEAIISSPFTPSYDVGVKLFPDIFYLSFPYAGGLLDSLVESAWKMAVFGVENGYPLFHKVAHALPGELFKRFDLVFLLFVD